MLLSFTVQFLELLFKTFDAFFVWFFLSFFFIKPEVNLFSLFRKSLFAYINPFIRMFIIKSVQDFPMQFILIFIVILYFFFNLIIFFLMFFNENLIKHKIVFFCPGSADYFLPVGMIIGFTVFSSPSGFIHFSSWD